MYWFGFYHLIPKVGGHKGRELKIHRKLFFHEEHGYPVQWHEQLNFSWVITSTSADFSHYADEEIEIVEMRGELAD